MIYLSTYVVFEPLVACKKGESSFLFFSGQKNILNLDRTLISEPVSYEHRLKAGYIICKWFDIFAHVSQLKVPTVVFMKL